MYTFQYGTISLENRQSRCIHTIWCQISRRKILRFSRIDLQPQNLTRENFHIIMHIRCNIYGIYENCKSSKMLRLQNLALYNNAANCFVLQLDTLERSQLAARLTLNCSDNYVEPQKLKDVYVTIMDVSACMHVYYMYMFLNER